MPSLLKLSFLKLSLIYLAITSSAFADENFNNWYKNLSDEQKVSQLFITGLRGPQFEKRQKEFFKRWPVSGVIYFRRNFKNQKQFVSLNRSVLKALGPNAFSFADQEGGSVIRVGTPYDSPTALSVGKLANKKITSYLGKAYGSLLKNLSISANLAPVVDIKDKTKNDFISNRSYGSNPELVSSLSLEFSKGLLKSGTLPTLKHFPGLGGLKQDTHKSTPLKVSKLNTLMQRDWLPYIRLAEANIPFFVMSSHTQFVLDGKDLGVVTYSKESIDHLRAITSKDQVVVTDDLEMTGAKINGLSFPEAAFRSFMSGHDLLLIGWPGKKLHQTLFYFKDKLKGDFLFQDRLRESLARIYILKQKKKSLSSIKPFFTTPDSLKLSRFMNSKITNYLLKKEYNNTFDSFPETQDFNSTLIFSSDPVFKKPFYTKLKTFSLLRTPNSDIYKLCKNKNCLLHLTGNKTSRKIQKLLNNYKDCNFVIVNSVDPNLISSVDRKKHRVFNVLTRSYGLGKRILQLIRHQSLIKTNKKIQTPKRPKSQKVVSLPLQN